MLQTLLSAFGLAASSPVSSPEMPSTLIVLGSHSSHNSSVAFQLALDVISNHHGHALVIEHPACAQQSPVRLAKSIKSLTQSEVSRLEFVYAESLQQCAATLAMLGTHYDVATFLPDIIVVELSTMVDTANGPQMAAYEQARALAVLDNTIRWIRQRGNTSAFGVVTYTARCTGKNTREVLASFPLGVVPAAGVETRLPARGQHESNHGKRVAFELYWQGSPLEHLTRVQDVEKPLIVLREGDEENLLVADRM